MRIAFVLLAAALLPAVARADDPPRTDVPLADKLFREGKQLLADGHVDEACPKFQESQRLDPSGGTLMNLARCHRMQSKWATAYAEYSDAYSAAKREQREDRLSEAKTQLDELEPLVMHVTLVVPPEVAALPGFTIARNGVSLSAASWGTVQPVDPGVVLVEASASGYEPYRVEVPVTQPGASIDVPIPMLERSPVVAPAAIPWRAPTPTPVAPAGMPPTRIAGIVVGSAGVVSVILGAIAGGVALSKQSDADAICPGTICPADAVTLNEDAHSAATLANVGVFGGLGLTAIGVILVAVNPGAVRPTASGLALRF
jgi:hypothetical protein